MAEINSPFFKAEEEGGTTGRRETVGPLHARAAPVAREATELRATPRCAAEGASVVRVDAAGRKERTGLGGPSVGDTSSTETIVERERIFWMAGGGGRVECDRTTSSSREADGAPEDLSQLEEGALTTKGHAITGAAAPSAGVEADMMRRPRER